MQVLADFTEFVAEAAVLGEPPENHGGGGRQGEVCCCGVHGDPGCVRTGA
jgi:hypothetical protein